MYCDLHIHSIHSDGSLTPAELVAGAAELGLSAIALTDHNTVAGLPDFLAAARARGITAVPGVELSTQWGEGELHLLGYFIDPVHYEEVESILTDYRRRKEQSNLDLIARLNAAGYAIDYANVEKRAPGGNINRAPIAEELMALGYAASVNEAFDTLLEPEHGYYIPPAKQDVLTAIRFLRSIGAVPVLAHPLKDLDVQGLRELLPVAAEAGLLGLEVYHSSFDEAAMATARALADEYGLAHSGGSDFHGSAKPTVRLGTGKGNLAIPHAVYEGLRALAE